MACRSLPVVSEPILPSGTAPTLFCSALMSEVDSDPSASTPIHSCRARVVAGPNLPSTTRDRKSTRLNSSHVAISYAVFCLKKKNILDKRPSEPTPYLTLLHASIHQIY